MLSCISQLAHFAPLNKDLQTGFSNATELDGKRPSTTLLDIDICFNL